MNIELIQVEKYSRFLLSLEYCLSNGRSSHTLFPFDRNFSYRFLWRHVMPFLSCATTLFFYLLCHGVNDVTEWKCGDKTAIVCMCDVMRWLGHDFVPIAAYIFYPFLRIFSTYLIRYPTFLVTLQLHFYLERFRVGAIVMSPVRFLRRYDYYSVSVTFSSQ